MKLNLLLVEDNPADAMLVQETIAPAPAVTLLVKQDGDDAQRFLDATSPDALPTLVLLDWNLPCRSGREILAYIKTTPKLCTIPVLVLSSSQADADVRTAYELGASCFLKKPLTLDEFVELMRRVQLFWLHSVLFAKNS